MFLGLPLCILIDSRLKILDLAIWSLVMDILNLLPGLLHHSSFRPRCTIKYMTNLCRLYFKHVSRTTFMHSYRFPAQNFGFSNIEPSYGHFKLFPGLLHYSSFRPRCTIKYMTNLCRLYFKHVSRTTFMHSYRFPA